MIEPVDAYVFTMIGASADARSGWAPRLDTSRTCQGTCNFRMRRHPVANRADSPTLDDYTPGERVPAY